MLTTCGLQLISGRLYAQYSLKWIFLGAIGLFEVGSLICGVAPSSVALIIGRAVQGIGASGMFYSQIKFPWLGTKLTDSRYL